MGLRSFRQLSFPDSEVEFVAIPGNKHSSFALVEPKRRDWLAQRIDLLGVPISRIDLKQTINLVARWVNERQIGRTITFANVHMLVEASKSPMFAELLRSMDLNCPDGMPLVWMGKAKTRGGVSQVCGPDFFEEFCRQTATSGIRHFLYGGDPGVAEEASIALMKRHRGLEIAGSYAPPFRPLSKEEDQAVVELINKSGANVVWVCLGCPKQERWIHQHKDKLEASVLLAVGQAFDLVAGRKKRAPAVLRRYGLEWFYRLLLEPRRLGRRYLVYNPMFIALLIGGWLQARFNSFTAEISHENDEVVRRDRVSVPPRAARG